MAAQTLRMLSSFLLAFQFLVLVFSGHRQVALENIALRHQLAVFTREKKRPRLRDRDRLFWMTLQRLWKDWRSALVFVSFGLSQHQTRDCAFRIQEELRVSA
jgi:hypothetical protein